MASDIVENNEVLVLSDTEGNIFAIPRDTVERYLMTPEQKAEIEKQIGDDVAGFEMQSTYMTEKLAGFHQADMLREATESRRAREATRSASSEGTGGPGMVQGFANMITGVWRTLATSKPAPPISGHS